VRALAESVALACRVPVEWLAIPGQVSADPAAIPGLDTAAVPDQVAAVDHPAQSDDSETPVPDSDMAVDLVVLGRDAAAPEWAAKLPVAERSEGQSRREDAGDPGRVHREDEADLDRVVRELQADLDRAVVVDHRERLGE
jgi:hypothetical protein